MPLPGKGGKPSDRGLCFSYRTRSIFCNPAPERPGGEDRSSAERLPPVNRLIAVLSVALLLGPVLSLALGDRVRAHLLSLTAERVRPPGPVAGEPPVEEEPVATPEPPPPLFEAPAEDSVYQEAIRTAWAYVEWQYQPGTGLVNSVIRYPYATIWDIGSSLAAHYCGYELGLISWEQYETRMARALETLQELPLHAGVAFNKNYEIARGFPAGRNDRDRPPRADGYGWSATDLGRLLVWLRIIAENHPEFADEAEAVVQRLDFETLLGNGYLRGGASTAAGTRTYQEGRIGYEQYAAAGFALWGHVPRRALNWEANVEPIEVAGVPLLTDRRPGAHLTSEPFFLMGIELGWWDDDWLDQARQVLAAQEARYDLTGQLTMVSEDAIPKAPYFFYYYTLQDDDTAFAVRALGPSIPEPEPRWLSTKAAFAWHALFPRPYTWRVVDRIAGRAGSTTAGWSSGLYEETLTPTGGQNINTAAVVLEAELYRRYREPLLTAGGK